jgi:hypothetical protein
MFRLGRPRREQPTRTNCSSHGHHLQGWWLKPPILLHRLSRQGRNRRLIHETANTGGCYGCSRGRWRWPGLWIQVTLKVQIKPS